MTPRSTCLDASTLLPKPKARDARVKDLHHGGLVSPQVTRKWADRFWILATRCIAKARAPRPPAPRLPSLPGLFSAKVRVGHQELCHGPDLRKKSPPPCPSQQTPSRRFASSLLLRENFPFGRSLSTFCGKILLGFLEPAWEELFLVGGLTIGNREDSSKRAVVENLCSLKTY